MRCAGFGDGSKNSLDGATAKDGLGVADDDWRRKNPFFQEPQLTQNLAIVEKLRPIAEAHGKTVGNLAAAWVLSHPALTCAIIGARSPQQVEQNMASTDWPLTDEEKMNVLAALGN